MTPPNTVNNNAQKVHQLYDAEGISIPPKAQQELGLTNPQDDKTIESRADSLAPPDSNQCASEELSLSCNQAKQAAHRLHQISLTGNNKSLEPMKEPITEAAQDTSLPIEDRLPAVIASAEFGNPEALKEAEKLLDETKIYLTDQIENRLPEERKKLEEHLKALRKTSGSILSQHGKIPEGADDETRSNLMQEFIKLGEEVEAVEEAIRENKLEENKCRLQRNSLEPMEKRLEAAKNRMHMKRVSDPLASNI